MEDLAAYAVMASASAGLCKELLFPSDDESTLPASRESSFLEGRLAALRRQEDEDDDMTIALLSTIWNDEVIAANLVAQEDNQISPPLSQVKTKQDQNVKQPSVQVPRPAKRTKSTQYMFPYGEFGLRLNLDMLYQPTAPQYGMASADYYQGDHLGGQDISQHHGCRFAGGQQDIPQHRFVGGPDDRSSPNMHSNDDVHDLGNELALGNENPFHHGDL